MRLKGFIRRGADDIEVALQEGGGKLKPMASCALLDTIKVFYNFVVSGRTTQVYAGRAYTIEQSSFGINTTRRVTFMTIIGPVTLTRYSQTFDGLPNQSDKVSLTIDIPTVEVDGEEESANTEGEYNDAYPT